ncbi:glycosyltransferase family 4 protein [bacterium]|nr:glycosyltransferase family 4 protein [bacterium]
MAKKSGKIKLVYMTTVPMTLTLVRGQPGYMRSCGIEVHVLSSSGEMLENIAHEEHVHAHKVDMLRGISPLRDLISLMTVCREFRRIRPHIVHSNTAKGGFLGMLAAWITGVPVRIYHVHGQRFVTMSGAGRVIVKFTEKIACRLAHRVLCVSRSIMDLTIDEGICPPHKIKVLHCGSVNGIDSADVFNPVLYKKTRAGIRAKYDIPHEAVVIGFVGRIVRDKGIAELVDALELLRRQYSNVHLLIVGDFEDGDSVDDRTRRIMHSDPNIHLAGFVRDTPPFYAAMDIFTLPSYREGLGMSALEASAMELPVVATRITGCVDAVVDGITGCLVPPKDSDTLAQAIKAYIDNPNLRREHGRAGRQRVSRDYCRGKIWDATLREYARLLDNKNYPLPQPCNEVMHDEATPYV